MKKTTRGALAAAASASLLLGGAGSLAYWNTTDNVTAGAFATGNLVLDAGNCDIAGWTVTNTVENVTNAPVTLSTYRAVPGDVLTKTCQVVVDAVGTNLTANLAVTNLNQTFSAAPASGVSNTAAPSINPTPVAGTDFVIAPTFKIGNATITQIKGADLNKTIDVEIKVTFPIRATTANNDLQYDVLTLADYTVVATQAGANVTPSASPAS